MEQMIIEMMQAFVLGFFLAYFEPLQHLLGDLRAKVKSKNKYVRYILQGVSCHICLATWITFGMTLNIFAAAAMAVIVYVFDALMLKMRS